MVCCFRYLTLKASKDEASADTAALVQLFLTERPNDNLQNDLL